MHPTHFPRFRHQPSKRRSHPVPRRQLRRKVAAMTFIRPWFSNGVLPKVQVLPVARKVFWLAKRPTRLLLFYYVSVLFFSLRALLATCTICPGIPNSHHTIAFRFVPLMVSYPLPISCNFFPSHFKCIGSNIFFYIHFLHFSGIHTFFCSKFYIIGHQKYSPTCANRIVYK